MIAKSTASLAAIIFSHYPLATTDRTLLEPLTYVSVWSMIAHATSQFYTWVGLPHISLVLLGMGTYESRTDKSKIHNFITQSFQISVLLTWSAAK